MSSKVEQWIACDLRYVAETKLGRLTEDELARLYFGLGKKHSLSITSVSADRGVMIEKLMQMKKEIQVAYGVAAAKAKAESTAEAAKAVEAIFATEGEGGEIEGEEGEEGEAPVELTEEELAAKRDREERAAAFIQLAAAVAAEPEPPPPSAPAENGEIRPSSPVTVDSHHRLRVCSFNACKMRLGNANKAYVDASECADKDEYEGTHKGAELAQKWLTLAARMADFDVIVLQEVPGTEKVMNEKVETFAAMLEIATEEGQFWTAVSSQKSGKDGKVVGPGAEVHVCFIKSPIEFKGWNTLRKVGATELDYAPLQVVLHDPRFADPADQSFVITSVHLPPSKRVDARDSQIAALLRNYSAPDTSEYRMQLPFKPNKESKVAPTHIIAGDFNTYPGNEQYNMLGSGFVSKIPKDAATTSGHQNYDNVLVDACANDRLLIGGGILQLKNPHTAAKGEVGLSDHYPVLVEVCEVQKTGKQPAAALPVVESEFVAGEDGEDGEDGDAQGVPPPPPLGLTPVPEEDQEPAALEEAVVKEVVDGAMEKIMRGVLENASEAMPSKAPAEAAASTEEPPLSPPPEPEPERDASPNPPPSLTPDAEEEASKALDREVAEALGADLETAAVPELGPEPEPGPEPGPATTTTTTTTTAPSSEESFVIA